MCAGAEPDGGDPAEQEGALGGFLADVAAQEYDDGRREPSLATTNSQPAPTTGAVGRVAVNSMIAPRQG